MLYCEFWKLSKNIFFTEHLSSLLLDGELCNNSEQLLAVTVAKLSFLDAYRGPVYTSDTVEHGRTDQRFWKSSVKSRKLYKVCECY